MATLLAAAGGAIAAGDLWLVVVCWKRRTVLGGLAGAVGIPLVALAIASGARDSAGEGALVIALVLLFVGVGLYVLGQVFERLLDDCGEKQT